MEAFDLAARPNDKTGERILGGLLADAGQQLPDEGIAGDVSVLKASADPAGSPRGCQEDYLVARRGEFGRLAGVLIPFLAARQLICGAGAVAQTPSGAVYCLSRPAVPTGGAGTLNLNRSLRRAWLATPPSAARHP